MTSLMSEVELGKRGRPKPGRRERKKGVIAFQEKEAERVGLRSNSNCMSKYSEEKRGRGHGALGGGNWKRDSPEAGVKG